MSEEINDYLYKQLYKLSSKDYFGQYNSLASDSLVILEIVKYLNKEKKLEATTHYPEHIDIEKVIKEQLEKFSKSGNLTYH